MQRVRDGGFYHLSHASIGGLRNHEGRMGIQPVASVMKKEKMQEERDLCSQRGKKKKKNQRSKNIRRASGCSEKTFFLAGKKNTYEPKEGGGNSAFNDLHKDGLSAVPAQKGFSGEEANARG